jgi:hypothetical protein
VFEDANSIQMSLMQIMRLLLTGQIEHKTASLLLYALQTASTNLRQTNFKPWIHEVVLDPRDAAESILNKTNLWDDKDFEEEVEEGEVDEVEQEIRTERGRGRQEGPLRRPLGSQERHQTPRARTPTLRGGREGKGLGTSRIPDTGWSAVTAACSPNNDRKKKIPPSPPPQPLSRSTKSPPPAPRRSAKKSMT